MKKWIRAVIGALLVVSTLASAGVGFGAVAAQVDQPNASNTSNATSSAPPAVNGTGAGGGSNVSAGNATGPGGLPTPASGNNTTPAPGAGVGNGSNATAGNATGNGTAANSSGNSSGVISGAASAVGGAVGGAVPSAGDWLEDAAEWLRTTFTDGIEAYVGYLNEAFVGIATPGETMDVSSWLMPTNSLWGTSSLFYMAMASLSSIPLAGAVVYLFDVESRQKQRELLKNIGRAVAGILFGQLFLGLYLNAFDQLSVAVAPNGTDFIQTSGGLTNLALGHVIVLILAYVNGGIILAGGFIMFLIYIYPFIVYGFWPMICAGKALPVRQFQSPANLGLMTIIMLPILRFIQSLLLTLAFSLSWNGMGIAGEIAELFGQSVILLTALLALPWIFYKNIETASGMALSTITVKQSNRAAGAAGGAGRRVGSRASSAAAPYVDSARSSAATHAANAKRRAGSRAGGAMLTAKYGRPGSGSASGSSSSSGSGSRSRPDTGSSRGSMSSGTSPSKSQSATASSTSPSASSGSGSADSSDSTRDRSSARRRALRRERRNTRNRNRNRNQNRK